MLEFCRIIFLNAWRGTRRANVLPAIVLTFASIGVLLIGSNASASTSAANAVRAIGKTVATQTHHMAQQLSLVPTSSNTPASEDKQVPDSTSKQKSSDSSSKTSQSTQNSDKPSANANNPSTPATSVQLSEDQPTCQQGQVEFIINSALLNLPSPVTSAAGNASWQWESRIDSGTNSSGTFPVSDAESTQAVATGATQITVTGNQSGPLLSTPANQNYAYSFRLHIVYNSIDYTSDWVHVPQASATVCPPQN